MDLITSAPGPAESPLGWEDSKVVPVKTIVEVGWKGVRIVFLGGGEEMVVERRKKIKASNVSASRRRLLPSFFLRSPRKAKF